MNILSPSVLSIDFNNVQNNLEIIDKAGAKYVHLDVMDGNFVPNISFGAPIIKSMRKITDRVFDVHLMIDEPIRYINDFKDAGADIITVHAEACKHLHSTISAIKKAGLKAGVALNPATPINVLEYVLNEIDMVLVMSVNPGFGGQSFIPEALTKIKQVKEMIDKNNKNIDIQVDGGITLNNVKEVVMAGANIIVAGSAVFNGDIKSNTEKFVDILEQI